MLLVITFPAPHFPLCNGHPAHFSPAETPRILTAETSPHPAQDAPHYIGARDNVASRTNPTIDSNFQVIIFGVNEDISNEQILDESKARTVKRLGTAKPDGSPRPVVLSFSNEPPSEVKLGFKIHKTSIFIPKPTRCLKCQLFGHISSHCKGARRCPICAESHTNA